MSGVGREEILLDGLPVSEPCADLYESAVVTDAITTKLRQIIGDGRVSAA